MRGRSEARQRWVVPLALTVMTGFGVILYGFSVYSTGGAAGSEYSTTVLSVAYGGSVFVGGLLAFPVGRVSDRHGIRRIVTGGAIAGCLGLAAFSAAREPWQVVVSWWALIGPAQAMIYYEPAYVAIDQWGLARDRAKNLATITFIGGLAGIAFIPGAAWLVDLTGWRNAVLILGVVLLLVGLVTAVVFLPRGAARSTGEEAQLPSVPGRPTRERRFILYTLALALMLLSTQGVIAHRIARFEETGFSISEISIWAAVASALSLPGRWVAPRLAERYGPIRVQATIALLVAASIGLMVDGTDGWQMTGHFFLFGLAFGALLPLRAMVMGDWYSGPAYGRIMGAQWTPVVLVAASGPVAMGVLRDASGGYALPAVIITVLFVGAGGAVVASGRAPQPPM
ncbi:MAG: MFS transporter [Acidimicrobiia bacterium]|nr:MFS transporter [Acidimicrobiia bacterium]